MLQRYRNHHARIILDFGQIGAVFDAAQKYFLGPAVYRAEANGGLEDRKPGVVDPVNTKKS